MRLVYSFNINNMNKILQLYSISKYQYEIKDNIKDTSIINNSITALNLIINQLKVIKKNKTNLTLFSTLLLWKTNKI